MEQTAMIEARPSALCFLWRGRLAAPIAAHGFYDMVLLIGLYFRY